MSEPWKAPEPGQRVRLPVRVKVGWKMFTVVEWDPAVAEAQNKYGECDHINRTIRVDTTRGVRQTAETLWHECLHAAFDISGAHDAPGADGDRYTEEQVVSVFGSWSMTMFVDNPELVRFLAWAAEYGD